MKKRILFIDDEPKVLSGLRRMLRDMGGEWEMYFCERGEEALHILASQTFDVVVSNMRMPGMDGAQLLAEVKERYPQTVRIVLSGHSDKEYILKSALPTHQYLSKPCDPEVLKNTIAKASAVRELLNNSLLRKVVSQIESLPSLPENYHELIRELESEYPSLKKISLIIAKDVSMMAKILQLVNSSFFGLRRRVSNPELAVSLLGLDNIKSLFLAVGIFSQYEDYSLPGFLISKLWKHSIAVSSIAGLIAKKENAIQRIIDDSLMGGLLHDIGRLILAANFQDEYKEILMLSKNENMTIWDAEQSVLQTTHAEIGAYLLGLWGLPDNIVETLAFHHSPGNYPIHELNSLILVHVADAFDNEAEYPFKDISSTLLDRTYLQKAGLLEKLEYWREIYKANDNELESSYAG